MVTNNRARQMCSGAASGTVVLDFCEWRNSKLMGPDTNWSLVGDFDRTTENVDASGRIGCRLVPERQHPRNLGSVDVGLSAATRSSQSHGFPQIASSSGAFLLTLDV
jgi:hypothetical protein